MSKNTIPIIIGFVILVIMAVLFFLPGFGHKPFHRGPWFDGPRHGKGLSPLERRERFLSMMKDRLNLSHEQYETIQKIHRANENKLKKFRIQFKQEIEKFEPLLLNDSFNEKQIRKQLKTLDAIKREEKIIHIKTGFETRRHLTPEQKKEFDRFIQKRFHRHKEHRGPRP